MTPQEAQNRKVVINGVRTNQLIKCKNAKGDVVLANRETMEAEGLERFKGSKKKGVKKRSISDEDE